MASPSKPESQSPHPSKTPPTLAPATDPPSLAPATAPPSPFSISAGKSPEVREVALTDIKIYQRRHKVMKNGREHLDAQKNWSPETPVKLVPVRPHTMYVKRKLKGPSFLSRICKAEAEANHDNAVMTSATVVDSKFCSKSGVSIDLNKSISDTEGVGSKVDVGSVNPLFETGMFNHGGGLVDGDVVLMDNSELSTDMDNSELSTDLSLALPGECAIDKGPDASFRGLDIMPENPPNNLPKIRYLSDSVSDNPESHAIGRAGDRENHSLYVENDELHPVQPLEPATPLTMPNKRPSNCRDTNPRPVKKLKIKKKRHRPRVAVDGVPKRPVKKLPAKKEKVTRVKKTQQRGKEKNSVRKRLKMSNSEVSTIQNDVELVAADSSLSSVLTRSSVLTVDDKIVGIQQSSVGSGPGTVDTGEFLQSSVGSGLGTNGKVLLAIPELPSIHSTHDNVAIVSELHLETKSTPQSDVFKNIPSVERKVVCRYELRIRQPLDSCGHKEVNLCARNCISEEFSFPKEGKSTRMKRKRRPRVTVILLFFQLKGHVKKKRSKSFMRRGKMAGLQGKTLTGGTKEMEYLPIAEEGSVSNPSKELPIGEEQGDNHEIYAPQSLLVNQDQESIFQPTLSQYEILILKPFEALQLIDKPTGTEKAFNHEDSFVNKEEPCIRRTDCVASDFMMPSIGETSLGASNQDNHSVKAGAVVPYKGFPYPEKGAIVTHQAFLIPKKNAIVVHLPPAKKFRPVIELDPETLRRWNQMKRIEDGLGEEEVEVDEETKRQWEKDRKIFRGHVDGFCYKMHLVLGNRKFKPWKGSVVDSVVGVFLTQNVSDFLSSSAYMSLAAVFPNKESDQQEFSWSQESTGSTSGTTDDLPSPQYFVTTYDDEEGLGDIEDIGKPILPRTSYRNEPLRTYRRMETKNSIPSFHDFYQTLCSSSAPILPQVVPDGPSNLAANSINDAASKEARTKTASKKDWARVRRKYLRPRSGDHTDTLDWEAVRQADSSKIANIIKARGQHTIIAARIKDFLNREVELHGSIDLEWLRHAPDLVVKNYLLDVQGLGLKSVECIRLLALNRVAFPVDVNVARIVVRLGWVPLKPLPGDVQFHLLEEYPILDSVQKYLMPRLREFDSPTLYEFHYQLITFGKIFCKKRNPNCGACPMRPECKHYASSVAASANLKLPGPTNEDLGRSKVPSIPVIDSHLVGHTVLANITIPVTLLEYGVTSKLGLGTSSLGPSIEEPKSPEHTQNIQYPEGSEDNHDGHVDYGLKNCGCVPIIEEPKSPEFVQESEDNCEDNNVDDNRLIDKEVEEEEEIPTIVLSDEVFRKNVQYYMDKNLNNVGNSSRALVPSLMDVNSSFVHKLKRAKHLRTEHGVYEIPDSHEILAGVERRDPDDKVPYLLAIWTAGETPNSVRQPEKKCNSEGSDLCDDDTCFACESIREGKADIVRGTILIPCRTAMRARFPLNGTYFQVNEVFADHETSCNPLIIPRSLIWNLRRRIVFFGTSPSSIFTNGCSLKDIQVNFWKGFICLRGFDRKTRAPKPLAPRFHCSPSKMEKTARKVNSDKAKNTQSKPKRFKQEKPNDDPNKPQVAVI